MTRSRLVLTRALILVAALVIALPAAADLVGMRQLQAGVSGKPASGFLASLTQSNLKETQELTPELWWGNYYMHQRYYSTILGRFVSVDPVAGRVGSSQSWNRYSYVLNNPIAFVDPYGEKWFNFNDEFVFLEDVDELHETVVNEDGTTQETVVKGNDTLVRFDGSKVTLFGAGGSTQAFPARSGWLDSNLNSQPNLQDVADVGPLPEGRWNFNPQEIQQYSNTGVLERVRENLGGTAWPGGESSWGSQRVWLNPESYKGPRSGFTIHGGDTLGSRGCIDLAGYGPAFFEAVDNSNQYIPLFVNYRKK